MMVDLLEVSVNGVIVGYDGDDGEQQVQDYQQGHIGHVVPGWGGWRSILTECREQHQHEDFASSPFQIPRLSSNKQWMLFNSAEDEAIFFLTLILGCSFYLG